MYVVQRNTQGKLTFDTIFVDFVHFVRFACTLAALESPVFCLSHNSVSSFLHFFSMSSAAASTCDVADAADVAVSPSPPAMFGRPVTANDIAIVQQFFMRYVVIVFDV